MPTKTAIEARQAVFKLINNQSGPVGSMFRPNATARSIQRMVARNAERVRFLLA